MKTKARDWSMVVSYSVENIEVSLYKSRCGEFGLIVTKDTETNQRLVTREFSTYADAEGTYYRERKADKYPQREYKVEFVSYDGKWPNLCSGNLIMKLDDKTVEFPAHCLRSGGRISAEYERFTGPWDIAVWPEEWPGAAKQKAINLVNENIEPGCCGGCI